MSATDNADGMEDSATSASVVTSFTSSDADDEGLGTTTYSVSTSTSDAESTASSSTVTEVRHKRYVVTSSAGRLSSIPAGDPVGPEPPSAPTADIVALNARFMYYVDRVRFLEQENRTLRHSVTELEIRSVSPEMYRTFQQEIDRGRQKVSDLNAERSHLQVEVQRLEREMRAFNYKVFEESKSRKEAVRELEKLKTELYETKKAYKDAQDNLRLKAQEQDFKTRTHEQDDISSSTCSAPGSVQGGPVPPGQEVNEVRKEVLNISLELEKLRNENTKVEIDILGTKGELQQYITGSEFEGNAQLEADVRQVEHYLTAARLQNRQVEIDILEAQEELQLYITGSEGNSQLQAEVHQVSHNASTEVTQYVSMLEKREVELETLHHSLQEQREEYEKLMHMKLDLELALKHHGLDYTTIQYDVHDWSPSHHHRSSTPKGTPIRRRPLRDMDHSNKKRKTEHPSSADGSFLADEAAYVSAEGGGSASFATESGGHSGCVISESYTIDESTSRRQTRLGQTNGTAGGGGDGQLAMAETRAVDAPGLSGPRRILTASGEYVVASATSTVRHSGEAGDTAMGMTFDQTTTVRDEDRPGLSGPKRVLTASGEFVMEDQTTTTTVTTEDRSGLSGPKRVLTASGEYAVVTSSSEDQTTTSTVTTEDRPGLSGPKRILTSSGEYVVISSEDQTTTTTVTTEDRPGLSGPKRVLTASGEYVVMSSEDQTTTTTSVQAEDRPGLSGPKRVLTASGEYVVEDQTTTATVTTEDRSGLSGPKRVLTASGEYVVVTSSSEHQTTTTTKGGVSTEQVKRVAGAREAGTGGYLGTDDVDGTRVTSGGYVAESSTEQRVREGGEGTQKYSMGVTETTTTKKRRSKGGKGHAEGSTTSYSLHQETQTTGDLETHGRSTDDVYVAPSAVATTAVATADISEKVEGKISMEDSGVSVTIKTDRNAHRENSQEETVVTTHYLGNEPLVKEDFEERGMSGRENAQDKTTTEATSFSGNTQMGVHMWGKFPTTQAQTVI
ncbi:uncharacterized protein [Branchiostoma lanceolatum]|uniref:uncharacterized protein isoform X2 n=1 Tax=Branchiostoma lanceolatum TaxID=7740 RepID=UPI003454AE46